MYTMKVLKWDECGHSAALKGISLNKNQPMENMPRVAKKLASHDYGHNKFQEHMMLWLVVTAPRYWWSEADTYRLSSKSSGSTMHTLKQELDMSVKDFKETSFEDPSVIPDSLIHQMKKLIEDNEPIYKVKQLLPESFLQTRMWMMSYKTFRNICIQRYNHRLPHWKSFCDQVMDLVDYPEYLEGVCK